MKISNLITAYLIIFLTSFIFACGSKTEEKNLKILYDLTKDKPLIDEQLKIYVEKISNPDDVSSEEDILEIFSMRDTLMLNLYSVIEEYYWVLNEKDDFTQFEELEKELIEIGITTVYAEGMYVGLVSYPIFETQIKEIGSEPFRIYVEFMNEYSASQGGEYPYMDLTNQMKMIELGEKLYFDYPNNEYTEKIKSLLFSTMELFTDFHKVTDFENDYTSYVISGLEIEFWPFATDYSNYEKFLNEYPNLKIIPVVKEILKNTSEICIDNNDSDPIYLVTIEELDDYFIAHEKVNNFVINGIDIPHVVMVQRSSVYSYAVVYRFYSDKEHADRMLDLVKDKYPNAYMLKVNMYGQVL
ncbi:MAG: hypothetical protein JXA68_07425 [Ignavibacteriales bacterium]|nr:hypothetical protein [Ignavibacteriales bacterium]